MSPWTHSHIHAGRLDSVITIHSLAEQKQGILFYQTKADPHLNIAKVHILGSSGHMFKTWFGTF